MILGPTPYADKAAIREVPAIFKFWDISDIDNLILIHLPWWADPSHLTKNISYELADNPTNKNKRYICNQFANNL